MARIVSWFSCGAASAVATKIALDKYGKDNFIIATCFLENEHIDNQRFLKDCEAWYNHPITQLRSAKYINLWDMWERQPYIVGPGGAPCTLEFKKKVRQKFQKVSDVQVFGFTYEEINRVNRFRNQNPEVDLSVPLVDNKLTKRDCFTELQKAGIELPAMYKLGYNNNNCIGCVKGGAGYWNKIRRDFPDIFNRMATVERTVGASILRSKGKRLYLDELNKNAGRKQKEPDMECGLWCKGDEDGTKETIS
jgi:hypothetical protein